MKTFRMWTELRPLLTEDLQDAMVDNSARSPLHFDVWAMLNSEVQISKVWQNGQGWMLPDIPHRRKHG